LAADIFETTLRTNKSGQLFILHEATLDHTNLYSYKLACTCYGIILITEMIKGFMVRSDGSFSDLNSHHVATTTY